MIGSELIAQPFASDRYFHPRPSAVDYKADAAGGSNLGTKNPDLRKKVAERAEALKATAGAPGAGRPGDGLGLRASTRTSAPRRPRYQAARVAAARGLPRDRVRALIDAPHRAVRGDPRAPRRASTCCCSTSPWTSTAARPMSREDRPWPSTNRPAPAPSSSST